MCKKDKGDDKEMSPILEEVVQKTTFDYKMQQAANQLRDKIQGKTPRSDWKKELDRIDDELKNEGSGKSR